jgi:hypothetical protein
LGIGLTAAMRSVGSSVSPRILLEATALRMDGDQTTEVRRLSPAHVSRGLPGLFL